MSEVIKEIINHMEFLGYTITPRDEKNWTAKSETSPNFLIRPVRAAIHFMAGYPNKDINLTAEIANEINKSTWYVKFVFVDEESFSIETIFPNYYDKSVFGSYFNAVIDEIQTSLSNLISTNKTPELTEG